MDMSDFEVQDPTYDPMNTEPHSILNQLLKVLPDAILSHDGQFIHLQRELYPEGGIPNVPSIHMFISSMESNTELKVTTYHGKVLFVMTCSGLDGIDLEGSSSTLHKMRDLVFRFRSSLSICHGIPECDVNPDSDISSVFIEPLDNKIIFRSRNCNFISWDTTDENFCSHCSNLRQCDDLSIIKGEIFESSDNEIEKDQLQELKEIEIQSERGKIKPSKNVQTGDARKVFNTCENCDRNFRYLSSYEKHVENCKSKIKTRKTEEGRSEFDDDEISPVGVVDGSCMICLIQFQKSGNVKKHMRLHRQRLKRLCDSMCCPLCSEVVSTKYDLNKHFLAIHPDSGVCCVECQTIIRDRSKLYLHFRKRHHEKRHLCSECGEKFPFPGDLRVHLATYHQDHPINYQENPALVCDKCGKVFAHRRRLVSHLRVSHNKSQEFPCNLCKKVFYEKYRLIKHTQIHSGLKPYKCLLCDYRSVRKDNVQLHTKSVHKMEKSDLQQNFGQFGETVENGNMLTMSLN